MNIEELFKSHPLDGAQQNQKAAIEEIFLTAARKVKEILPNNQFQDKVNECLLEAKMYTVLALSQPKVK